MKKILLISIIILSISNHLCQTHKYNPVCGINKKTYSNNCLCKRANIQISYRGRCREKFFNRKFFGNFYRGNRFLRKFNRRRNHCNYAGPCNDYNKRY